MENLIQAIGPVGVILAAIVAFLALHLLMSLVVYGLIKVIVPVSNQYAKIYPCNDLRNDILRQDDWKPVFYPVALIGLLSPTIALILGIVIFIGIRTQPTQAQVAQVKNK